MDNTQLFTAIGQMMDEKLAEQEQRIRADMATKEDLKGFVTKEDFGRSATKEDLERFATKEDFERSATKEDLKGFATKEDLERFATKEDLERFATKEDLKGFATKEDLERFATKEDIHETRVLIETGYKRIESLLREDYGRVAAAADKVQDYDDVKSRVAHHEDALQNHNRRLTELESKAI